MENESGQHLGNELLGADEDDVVERVPDIRLECTASFQSQTNIPSAKEGNLGRNSIFTDSIFLVGEFFLSGRDDKEGSALWTDVADPQRRTQNPPSNTDKGELYEHVWDKTKHL